MSNFTRWKASENLFAENKINKYICLPITINSQGTEVDKSQS